MPKIYKYLNTMLDWEYGEVRKLVYAFYANMKKNFIILNNRPQVIWAEEAMVKSRRKGNRRTAAKWFKFVIATELVQQVPQPRGEPNKIYKFNSKFIDKYKINKPFNVYYIHKYTKKRLKDYEENAKKLFEKGVTPSNISEVLLQAKSASNNERRNIHKKLYPNNHEQNYLLFKKNYCIMMEYIMQSINVHGFCTKKEVMQNCKFIKIGNIKKRRNV